MSDSRFDDIFSAASSFTTTAEVTPTKSKTKAKRTTAAKAKPAQTKASDFWSNFENKDDRVRLNVDISTSLNDRLSEKAKQLGQTKSELVRQLIEWALEN